VSAEKFSGGGNREKKTSNSSPRKPIFSSCGGLGEALDNCPGSNLKAGLVEPAGAGLVEPAKF